MHVIHEAYVCVCNWKIIIIHPLFGTGTVACGVDFVAHQYHYPLEAPSRTQVASLPSHT